MKKIYKTPTIQIIQLFTEGMIAQSGDNEPSTYDITKIQEAEQFSQRKSFSDNIWKNMKD